MEGRHIFFEGFEAFHVVMAGHAIHDKPGCIGGVYGGFAQGLRPVEGDFGACGIGGNAFDDFHELHDVCGVKEVHAHQSIGVFECRSDLGDGDARGIGGEESFFAVDGL